MREYIEKIEELVTGWLKPLPRLPEGFKKWVSVNLWWITLIGVILSVIGVFLMIGALVTMLSIMAGTSSLFSYYYTRSMYSGWTVFASIVSMLFLAGTITLTAMAISPLKSIKKKGWTLLFCVLLLQVVSIVVNAILTLNPISFIFNIIFGAVCVAIGAYFLFEIREEFEGKAKKVEEKTEESK